MLKFSTMANNAKLRVLGGKGYSFSLPAGHACPFAMACLSKANRQTGTITDGKHTQFRCFAASSEAIFPQVRVQRWGNFEALRQCRNDVTAMAELIKASIPNGTTLVRVHVSGDFYSQAYFDAWLTVARELPNVKFYAYTKALTFWVARVTVVPENFSLTASYGGSQDTLIAAHGLRYAKVVYSLKEATELGLKIDHDDTHAIAPNGNFALLIHGVQAAGSLASKAVSALKHNGIGGYVNPTKQAQSRKRYHAGKYGNRQVSKQSQVAA